MLEHQEVGVPHPWEDGEEAGVPHPWEDGVLHLPPHQFHHQLSHPPLLQPATLPSTAGLLE